MSDFQDRNSQTTLPLVTVDWLREQPIDVFYEVTLDFRDYPRNGVGRKYTYCWCFEDGTFACIDCGTSRQARTIHELKQKIASGQST